MGVLEGASNQWRLIQHAGRKEMEILIFALMASYNAYRRQERVVAEPAEFQPFDLQVLRNSANVEPAGHTNLGSNGRSIPMNNSSASSLRPLVLNR
jgi:hypothetical protein